MKKVILLVFGLLVSITGIYAQKTQTGAEFNDVNGTGLSHVSAKNKVSEVSYHIPEAISPNGDGYNDQWFLDSISADIDKVEIFDRRGVLVYDKSNYTNEFVGKNNNGNDLPAATYFYVIKLKNDKKITGWLYITR